MGAGHSHRAAKHSAAAFTVDRRPRAVLLSGLLLAALVTLVSMVLLWPDQDRAAEVRDAVDFAAPGVTFPAGTVEQVEPPCGDAPTDDCGQLRVVVDEGASKGDTARVTVPPETLDSGLAAGDRVVLVRTPGDDGQAPRLTYFGVDRSTTWWWLVPLFVVVTVAVARWRGVLGLLGLGVAGAVMGWFVLPALLTGESPVPVVLVGASLIMFVVLYSAHGVSIRTSAALAGTLLALLATAGIGHLAASSAHLTGVTDEAGGVLTAYAGDLAFQGLLTAAIVVAGLGALNDVTITQASAVWELRAAAPGLTRRSLFGSAMRIGRDHIASSIYTIVFAYAGTALLLLLVLQLYGLPLHALLATEDIAQEVARTLATSIGLVLSVPLTTAIAALTVPGPRREG